MTRMQGGGAAPGDAVMAAHARLLADRSLQFAFTLPPRRDPPPPWLISLLRSIGHALRAGAPAIRVGLWVALAAVVALVAYVIVRQWMASPSERNRRAAPLTLQSFGETARLAAARAAVRLADADRLAEEGRYGEAAHLLLLKGVEDVAVGRPGQVRPSLTSREIAALPGLPPGPRAAFTVIAAAVERALFAGRPIDADVWADCRTAYGALARPEAWMGGA